MTTGPVGTAGRPGRRDVEGLAAREAAARGLGFLMGAPAITLVAAIATIVVLDWLSKNAFGGGQSGAWVLDRMSFLGRAQVGAWLLSGLLTIAGCLLLARGSSTRRWVYTSVALVVAMSGASAVLYMAREGNLRFGLGPTGWMLMAERGLHLLLWVVHGFAVRHVMRTARAPVPDWAVAVWSAGLAGELLVGVASLAVAFSEPGAPRWDALLLRLFWLSQAISLSRVGLLFCARRSLRRRARLAEAGHAFGSELSWQHRAAEGLRLYRGGLIARIVITVVGVLAAFALRGAAPGLDSLLLSLAIPAAIAAAVMILGLFRFGSALPSSGGGAILGGVCLLVAGAVQVYATSTAWRLASYAEAVRLGTNTGAAPRWSELVDLARPLPALELGATAIALFGLLLVLLSLNWLVEHLEQPALRGRAAALSAGAIAIVFCGAGLRYHMMTARMVPIEVVIPLAALALVAALVFFMLYLKFLAELIAGLRALRPPIAPARVVSGGDSSPF